MRSHNEILWAKTLERRAYKEGKRKPGDPGNTLGDAKKYQEVKILPYTGPKAYDSESSQNSDAPISKSISQPLPVNSRGLSQAMVSAEDIDSGESLEQRVAKNQQIRESRQLMDKKHQADQAVREMEEKPGGYSVQEWYGVGDEPGLEQEYERRKAEQQRLAKERDIRKDGLQAASQPMDDRVKGIYQAMETNQNALPDSQQLMEELNRANQAVWEMEKKPGGYDFQDWYGVEGRPGLEKEYQRRKAAQEKAQKAVDALPSQKMVQEDWQMFARLPQVDQQLFLNYITAQNDPAETVYKYGAPIVNRTDAVDDEDRYAYLAAKYGKERVDRLIYTLKNQLNQQKAQQLKEDTQAEAQGLWGGALHSLGSVGAGVVSGVAGPIGRAVDALTRPEGYTPSQYLPSDLPSVYMDTARQTVGQNIQESVGGVGGDLLSLGYQAGMNFVDVAARAPFGMAGSMALAAGSTYSQSVSQALGQGATAQEAQKYALGKAFLEVGTEYLPTDRLFKAAKGGVKGLKPILAEGLKQAGAEATTEEINLLAGLVWEASTLKDKSAYQQMVGDAIARGATAEEAKAQANKDILNQALETALVSGLSGGASGVASGTVGHLRQVADLAAQSLPHIPNEPTPPKTALQRHLERAANAIFGVQDTPVQAEAAPPANAPAEKVYTDEPIPPQEISTPSYEELTAKPDIPIWDVGKNSEGKTYQQMKAEVLNRSLAEKWFDEPHVNKDTGMPIFLTRKSFTHSFSGLKSDFGTDTLLALQNTPKLLEDAVLVSTKSPKNSQKAESKVHTFLAAIRGENGVEPVKITVKEYDMQSENQPPQNILDYFKRVKKSPSYRTMYDMKALEVVGIESAKKEFGASANASGGSSTPREISTPNSSIRISDLMGLVKGDAEKYLPKPAQIDSTQKVAEPLSGDAKAPRVTPENATKNSATSSSIVTEAAVEVNGNSAQASEIEDEFASWGIDPNRQGVADPMADRSYSEAGKRSVKAYMYENPEVKPFFQEQAAWLLSELAETTKGERTYNEELYYESGGEKGWTGTKRHTSESIAELLDQDGMTYDEIERGLNAIVIDSGRENNAVSKRIEFLINDRLMNGYTDFFTGKRVPGNPEYLALLRKQQEQEVQQLKEDTQAEAQGLWGGALHSLGSVGAGVASGTVQNTPVQAEAAAPANSPVDIEVPAGYDGENTNGGNIYGAGEVGDGGVQSNTQNHSQGEIAGGGKDGRGDVQSGNSSGIPGELRQGELHTSDSEGRPVTRQQAEQLRESAVVDKSGAPIAMYHSTDNTEFDTFAKGDIGFHFGTREQAAKRGKDKGTLKGRTFRVYLNIKNPIHADLDIMGWKADGSALYLWSRGYLTDAESQEIASLAAKGVEYDSPASVRLREILEGKGYDGIAYPNGFEGKGDSYIAFHDDQVIRSEILQQEGTAASTQPKATKAAAPGKVNYSKTFTNSGVRNKSDAVAQAYRDAMANTPEDAEYTVHTFAQVEQESEARLDSPEKVTAEFEKLKNAETWTDTDKAVANKIMDAAFKSGNTEMVDYFSILAGKKKEVDVKAGQLINANKMFMRDADTTYSATMRALHGIKALDEKTSVWKQTKGGPDFKTWQKQVKRELTKIGFAIEAVPKGDKQAMKDMVLQIAKARKTTAWFGSKDRLTYAAQKILDKLDFDTLKTIANTQLAAMPDDFRVRGKMEVVGSYRVMAMLSSLKSIERNLQGNVTMGLGDSLSDSFPGRGMDMMLSKVTGKRTVGNDMRYTKEYIKAAKEATAFASLCVELGIPIETDAASSYAAAYADGKGKYLGKAFRPDGNLAMRTMYAYQKYMSYALEVTDKIFEGGTNGAVKASLENLKNANLTADEIDLLSQRTANRRTFKDDGLLAKWSSNIVNALNFKNDKGVVVAPLGTMVSPFVKIPMNLAQTGIDYTAGIVKGTAEIVSILQDAKKGIAIDAARQRKAVTDFGRGTTGLALMGVFTAAALKGILKATHEEDPDKRALEQSEGRSGAQWNWDAFVRALKGEDTEWLETDFISGADSLEPFNNLMYLSYDLSQAEGLGDIAKAPFNAIVASILDSPMMEGPEELVSLTTEVGKGNTSVGEALLEMGSNYVSSFIPQIARQTAQYIDGSYRDTTGASKLASAFNRVIASTGLSSTLPQKYGPLGDPQMRGGFFNTFLDPNNSQRYHPHKVTPFLEELSEATGDKGIYPKSKTPTSFTYHDGRETYQLTSKEDRELYAQTYGTTVNMLYEGLMDTPGFQELPKDVQVKSLKNAMVEAENLAKEVVLDQAGLGDPEGYGTAQELSPYEVSARAKSSTQQSAQSRLAEDWKKGYDTQADALAVRSSYAGVLKDSTVEEMMRLGEATKDGGVLYDAPSIRISYTDKTGQSISRNLTQEEHQAMVTAEAETVDKMVGQITALPDYQKLPDTMKGAALKDIYAYAREEAKKKALPDYHSDGEAWMKEIKAGGAYAVVEKAAKESLENAVKYAVEDLQNGWNTDKNAKLMDAAMEVFNQLSPAAKKAVSEDLEGHVAKYAEVKGKVSTEQYLDVLNDLLKAEKGDNAKYQAIAGNDSLSDSQKDVMMKAYMEEIMDKKYDYARQEIGLSPEEFAQAKTDYNDYTTGTGKKKRTVTYYTQLFGLSRQEAEDLYDMFSGSFKPWEE